MPYRLQWQCCPKPKKCQCERLSLYLMTFSVRRSFLELQSCHCSRIVTLTGVTVTDRAFNILGSRNRRHEIWMKALSHRISGAGAYFLIVPTFNSCWSKGLACLVLNVDVLRCAASSSACLQTANWPITLDSSSILATQDKPFSQTMYCTHVTSPCDQREPKMQNHAT